MTILVKVLKDNEHTSHFKNALIDEKLSTNYNCWCEKLYETFFISILKESHEILKEEDEGKVTEDLNFKFTLFEYLNLLTLNIHFEVLILHGIGINIFKFFQKNAPHSKSFSDVSFN